MIETKREHWLPVLLRSQVSNKEAEKLGTSPWWLFIAVILATTALSAFPLVNDQFKTVIASTNPANYPGLGTVFKKIESEKWLLRIDGGKLSTEGGVPAQVLLGKWLVVFESAGGSPDLLMKTMNGSEGNEARGVVFFGKTHFGIVDQDTKNKFDGTYGNLGGFRTADLSKVPADRMVEIFLYSSATGTVSRNYATVMLLMFVQVVSLVVIMGFLLSLSKVMIAGTSLGTSPRGAGFISSLKTAAGVALGPALLLCILLFPVPGGGAVSWVGFTLLFGGRIVFIYMARFRNKKKILKSTPVQASR